MFQNDGHLHRWFKSTVVQLAKCHIPIRFSSNNLFNCSILFARSKNSIWIWIFVFWVCCWTSINGCCFNMYLEKDEYALPFAEFWTIRWNKWIKIKYSKSICVVKFFFHKKSYRIAKIIPKNVRRIERTHWTNIKTISVGSYEMVYTRYNDTVTDDQFRKILCYAFGPEGIVRTAISNCVCGKSKIDHF